jgi:hypothetical protein
MIQKEYLTIKEISQKYNLSTRHVRRLVAKKVNETTKELIHKDENNNWAVHHLLLSKFKPKRKRKNKYYALTVDPCDGFTTEDIDKIMLFVFEQMNDPQLEINYTVEHKKANSRNHLHCFVKCSNRKRLLEYIKLGFSKVSYHESVMYDLEGWKKYITKDNNNITTLKKQN